MGTADQLLLCATEARPFVKWAGGKRKLVAAIRESAPASYQRYLEPFVGGGAVALALNAPVLLLNDANAELMNAYNIIAEESEELCELLDEHRAAHSETFFYQMRQVSPETLSLVERAARFIYLNKTCFNGLYRVNKKGEFNVPFGRHQNPVLYDRENLRTVSLLLQRAELYTGDYLAFLQEQARPGDFIYLDPPYVPIGPYSDFKRYTKEQFRAADQEQLAVEFKRLIELGAYPVLSNSYTERTLELYGEQEIRVVHLARAINHDGKGRGLVREILVVPKR